MILACYSCKLACFHVISVKFEVYMGNQKPRFWAKSWYKYRLDDGQVCDIATGKKKARNNPFKRSTVVHTLS